MPVSEVGDAVIGRGFGLMHDHDPARAVDSAQHPSTLDNPAFGWFGLSSAVRVRVGEHTRAVSVAEVVAPNRDAATRDLMVALVRAGVTATCSSADKPRYGDLTVDSNLPDTRIALGGPRENAFTAEVLAAADDAYTEELERQLKADGIARVWVPADAPLAQRWVPGADLRGTRALPVLVVAGRDGFASAVAALVEDLADAEVTVEQDAPSGIGGFEGRTVAVLNRGVPSFAVDTDGTLHTSLMRSCTGWPSGTWIDPPRRTAPDGSNFQLQHWTHSFDYAVVAADGDWRDAGLPATSAEFGQPLLGVVGTASSAGGLPDWGSLLEVEPARSVQLGTLKVAGNPIARGSAEHLEADDGLALRLVETRGRTTDIVVRSGLRNVATPERLDLLEQSRGPAGDALRLHGYEIATMRARLNMPRVLDGDKATLAPDAEVAQPLYARYWLHNRGPAPLGGLPVVAHLHPHAAAVDPGAPVQLQLTAASDCSDSVLHGRVRLVAPPDWTAEPDELPFMLPPGEHLETTVALTMPTTVAPGLYPVRAELAITGNASIPASWRQVVEDVCVVSVGETTDQMLRLLAEPQAVAVSPGDTATLSVTVGTDAYAGLAAEAHLISPWGTWEWLGPCVVGAEIPARGSVVLDFAVAPPASVQPGEWWALIRIACAGHLLYTPAVKVTVR
jgi:alpha-mannosidase